MQASKDTSKIMVTTSSLKTDKAKNSIDVKTLTSESECIHPSDEGWPTTIERLLYKHGIQLQHGRNQRSAVFSAIAEECEMSVCEREKFKFTLYCVTCVKPLRYHSLDGHAEYYKDHNITLALPTHRKKVRMRTFAMTMERAYQGGMRPKAKFYRRDYWR